MRYGKRIGTVWAYLLIISCFIAGTYAASCATTTVAQLIPMERDATIVIDAGHGGVDGGATSCTGILESSFNLDISLKLEALLHLLGYRTVMIRRSDISVYTSGETIAAKKVSDLRQRVKIIGKTPNPVVVSIHQNTFPDSKYSGAQIFYGSAGESEALAKCLQDQFKKHLNPDSNRSSKKAEGVYLMRHIQCTGVLVECGFLSNPQEEAKLRSVDYQQKVCAVIATTVGQFLTK